MTLLPRLILLLSLFASASIYAQEKQGRLISTVVENTGKPIVYATVSIFRQPATKDPVKTTYTDKKGEFNLSVDTGKYLLVITHVTLAEARLPVTVKTGDNIVDTIRLSTTPNVMQTVTITVRKPLIEQGTDRITYNVESDPAAKSESASDLLRKTPMITVDGDGNVQLNGQSNFKILMNGRETSMFAQNVKDALKNFPGAVISRIEVITSPSAKYDAEGVGGIINIVTKKRVVGYNGYISSYYSTLSNYSENASLNLKSGKLGMSLFIGGNGSINRILGRSVSETTPTTPALYSKRTLSGDRLNRNNSYYSNLELTYDIDSFQTVAFYGNLGSFKNYGDLGQIIRTDFPSNTSEIAYYNSENESKNPNEGLGLDFIRRYRNQPEKEFTVRMNSQFSRNELETNSVQDYPNVDRFVLNNSLAKNKEYTLQTDLTQPLANKQKLETGVKAILRSASSDFTSLIKYNAAEKFRPNPNNSNRFNYRQEVYSVYGSYSYSWKKYSLRTGVRGEYTHVYGDFESAKTKVEQSYFNVIPNVLLSAKVTPSYTFTGSYNLRLQRPYITSLNPFVNNSDSFNISYGNPELGPQVLHAVSLQNRFVKGKFFANISLNGSYTNTMIVQFISFDPATGITSTTSANIGREYQTSLGLNVNTPLGKKVTVGLNSQVRYNNVENKANVLQQNSGISGLLSGNFNWPVVGKFNLSGSGGIFKGTYSLVGSPSINSFYQINFGYKLFKDKLAVTMNVNNFHDKYLRFRNIADQPGFRIVNTSYNPYRVIFFGATYSFGKLKENVSKKKGISNDDIVQ